FANDKNGRLMDENHRISLGQVTYTPSTVPNSADVFLTRSVSVAHTEIPQPSRDAPH
ncbi:hypothetical protein GWI33_003537, partial [Rhynchophorus ferrugineus]